MKSMQCSHFPFKAVKSVVLELLYAKGELLNLPERLGEAENKKTKMSKHALIIAYIVSLFLPIKQSIEMMKYKQLFSIYTRVYIIITLYSNKTQYKFIIT